MKLTSTAFADGEQIPSIYTCEGDNVNPPLTIKDIPAGAQSLVLVMLDPDSPNPPFVHWTMWNIEPDTTSIPERSVPDEAIEGVTSTGKPGYYGPCPGSGAHRYIFTLMALDTVLDLPATADDAQLQTAGKDHVLASTTLMGRFEKTTTG